LENLYVDSIDLSGAVIAYETARRYTEFNQQYLLEYSFLWSGKAIDALDPDTRFRIRSLMLAEVYHIPTVSVGAECSEACFRGYNDTMFDEGIYTGKHLLRAVFSNKASSVGLPLIPVDAVPSDDSIMVDRSDVPSVGRYTVEGRDMPIDQWKLHTVTCRSLEDVDPDKTVLFVNLDEDVVNNTDSTFPSPLKLRDTRKRLGTLSEDLPSQFSVVSGSMAEWFSDKRKIRHRRKAGWDASGDFDKYNNVVYVSPDLLVRKEDGTFVLLI